MKKMKNYFFIILSFLLFLFSCNKDKKVCEPHIANINFLSSVVSFAYNPNTNYLYKVVDSNSLDSILTEMNLDIINNEKISNKIIGISLLFNSNDTVLLSSFTNADLDGIVFYLYNVDSNLIKTKVYKKSSTHSYIIDDYLSTNISYISSNDISKLSNNFSNGESGNIKMLILSTDFGDFNEIGKTYYSEFSHRVAYVDNNSSYTLAGGGNCGGICVEEVPDTYCHISSTGILTNCINDGESPICGLKRGFELVAPPSYTSSQVISSFNKQRNFRNEILLHSKKGVTYTSLYYYISSKLSNGYLLTNFVDHFDIIYNNLIPIIEKINDSSYTGVLYTSSDLDAFVDIIETLKVELNDNTIIVDKLNELKQDLINNVDENKATILNDFLNS